MNLQHHFLIAMPGLNDPLFQRSVVYICEHTGDGAMGIIINKTLDNMTIESILQRMDINPEPRDKSIRLNKPVFIGGPLAGERGFILHSEAVNFKSTIQIAGHTSISTSRDVLETLGTPEQPGEVLLALGYASWSKGQLEEEIKNNAWLTTGADNKILFHTAINERWQQAAKLVGVDIQMMPAIAGHD